MIIPSTGASVVALYIGSGGESRFKIPCRLRRVVQERPSVSVGHQTGGSDPPVPSTVPATFGCPLDLLDDEFRFSKSK